MERRPLFLPQPLLLLQLPRLPLVQFFPLLLQVLLLFIPPLDLSLVLLFFLHYLLLFLFLYLPPLPCLLSLTVMSPCGFVPWRYAFYLLTMPPLDFDQ